MASPTNEPAPAIEPQAQPQPQPAPTQPLTSATDDGSSRRPRDARLIHLVLSTLGIHSYQERVPLQLLDFAYRYTSSVLSDSLRLSAEGYAAAPGASSNRRADPSASDGSNITVTALRQAIASRHDYTFQARLPKEFIMEQAAERNRVMLPRIDKGWGVQLPPERYCLTGTAWTLKDEWESEGEDDEVRPGALAANGDADKVMGGTQGVDEDDDTAADKLDEDGEAGFDDVFGDEPDDREMGDA